MARFFKHHRCMVPSDYPDVPNDSRLCAAQGIGCKRCKTLYKFHKLAAANLLNARRTIANLKGIHEATAYLSGVDYAKDDAVKLYEGMYGVRDRELEALKLSYSAYAFMAHENCFNSSEQNPHSALLERIPAEDVMTEMSHYYKRYVNQDGHVSTEKLSNRQMCFCSAKPSTQLPPKNVQNQQGKGKGRNNYARRPAAHFTQAPAHRQCNVTRTPSPTGNDTKAPNDDNQVARATNIGSTATNTQGQVIAPSASSTAPAAKAPTVNAHFKPAPKKLPPPPKKITALSKALAVIRN